MKKEKSRVMIAAIDARKSTEQKTEAVPRMVPATAQNEAITAQHGAVGQGKTPRQVRDLPRGMENGRSM